MNLLLLMSAAAAAAAPAPSANWRTSSPEEARKILQSFASCAADAEPAIARRFVLLREGERLGEKEYQRLFDGRCLGFLGGQMRMRAWRSRAAIAEALIRRNPAAFRSVAILAAPPIDWASAPALLDAKADPATVAREAEIILAETQMSALGECVVRADPSAAFDVVQSKIDSDQEMSKLRALAPKIAGCVQQGQTISFNRTNLRSAMALAYYRLAVAAPAAPAPAGMN